MGNFQTEKEMERVWRIYTHPFYVENLKKNEASEVNRIFCRHNMEHFLDVARIAHIINLECGYQVEKELIYATALLHDIGKWQQYECGIPHEKSSAKLAEQILAESGFAEEESEEIIEAILAHRRGGGNGKLAEIIYEADKKSRPCFCCKAKEACNWSEEKKNYKIRW